MATKKIPDIFGAAEKLGKKIVPVFQIKVRKAKREVMVEIFNKQ